MKIHTAFLTIILLLSINLTTYTEIPNWVTRDPGMEKKVGEIWQRVEWQKNQEALDNIIENCIRNFVVPFALPAGITFVPGKDDMELTKERNEMGVRHSTGNNREKASVYINLPHEGVDIGSRISKDGGKTLSKLDNAKVKPMYPGGYIRANHGLEQKIICEKNGFRLILVLDYHHVIAASGIDNKWKPTPKTDNIGALDGHNSWDSLDPDLTKKMKDKGNHIHLSINGIYELTDEIIRAYNRQLQGKPISKDEADFLKRRAELYNTILAKTTGTYKKSYRILAGVEKQQ